VSTATNWLLLRGLAREQRHWYEFRELLAARLGVARVHCLDVAGAGTEHVVLPRPSVPWLARDVARRLPALGGAPRAGERWALVGLSLGGMLALELCRMFPLQFEAAVIINSSSRLTNASARIRPAAALQLLRAARSDDPLRREQLVLALTSALPEPERALYARRAADFAREAPPSRWAALAQLIAAGRFQPPDRQQIRARLAFVCSRDDGLVSPRCTHDLATWFGSACREHAWAGHDLPLDDPVWLCEHIAQFAEPAGAGDSSWLGAPRRDGVHSR
jgi:pimeloyl-ACP methyl ester carboxylesterase